MKKRKVKKVGTMAVLRPSCQNCTFHKNKPSRCEVCETVAFVGRKDVCECWDDAEGGA